VKDVRQRDITLPANPEVWLPLAQQNDHETDTYLTIRYRGSVAAPAAAVRAIVREAGLQLDPGGLVTLDQVVARTLAPQRYLVGALGAFGAIALSLAVFGLYSVMAFVTSHRTREIGIRIALGAQALDVLWMVQRDALQLLTAAAAVGVPCAYASGRLLSRYLYAVSSHDPLVLGGAVAGLLLTGLAASFLPARRAAAVEPTIALRSE
jgi:ABC-type antimicrobial peptide transport system permease subunit